MKKIPKPPKNKREYDEYLLELLRAAFVYRTCKQCKWPTLRHYRCTKCGGDD